MLLASGLGGCIVVPIAPLTQAPYADSVIGQLAQPGVDRSQVLRTLGKPDITKSGDKYWIYRNERLSFLALGPGGGMGFSSKEWLAVEFQDNRHVSFVGRGKGNQGCLANGICVLTDLYTFAIKDSRDAIFTAPNADDEAAKMFTPPANQCALYVFVDAEELLFTVQTSVHIAIDGGRTTDLEKSTYLMIPHAPGRLAVSANAGESDRRTLTTTCVGGERIYVRVTKSSSGLTFAVTDLGLAVPEEGAHDVNARRLALR